MERESRVNKSLLNPRMNLICYFVSLVVAFFTRKILLDYLGTEFIGFTGTLGSLLGFLSLAELGVGIAIGYVLYQPIFDDDKRKINEIISVLGYLYRKIGFFILGMGIVLSCFLPLIFRSTELSMTIVFLGFYSYLFSSLFSYFFNYRMSLLSADQRNYLVTGVFQIVNTSKVVIQMILAYYTKSFYLFLIIEFLGGLINSIILNRVIDRTYPWLKTEIKLGKTLFRKYPEIGKYIKQLFVHRIAGFVQFQTLPIFIYSFVSLPMVALYTNYTLVTQRIQGLMSGILDSTGAGVGNLISEGNQQKIYNVYKELFAVRAFISGVFACCVYYLIPSFIELWLGEEYLLSNLVSLLIVVQLYLFLLRGVTDQFLFGYGLFYDVWAPIAESIVFVLFSVVFGIYYGLPGVLFGPLVANVIIIYGWKPFFLFRKGFKRPICQFYYLLFLHLLPSIIVFFCATKISELAMDVLSIPFGWLNWVMRSVIFTLFVFLFLYTLFYPVSEGMREATNRFLKRKKL